MKPTVYPPKKSNTLIPGENDLKTIFPDIAEEIIDTDPSQIKVGSVKVQKWQCSFCENIWEAAPKSRTVSLTAKPGCPTCARKRAIEFRGQSKLLKDVVPQLIKELKNKSDADFLTYGSHKPDTEWICDSGHVYEMTVNRRVNGRKCPICNFKQVLVGFNDLASVRPDLVDEVVDKRFLNVLANSKEVIEWSHIAEDGVVHYWSAVVNDRVYRDSGCHVCSGKISQVGVNDFKTFLDTTDLKWSPKNKKKPEEYTIGSNKKVILFCDKHDPIYEIEDFCKKFSNSKGRKRICEDCRPTSDHFRSRGEIELVNFIESLVNPDLVETNVRRFKKFGVFELDVLIDEHFAFDFNGDFWHIEGRFKPVGFHDSKRKAVKDLGLEYFEVNECDWVDNSDSVKQSIREFLAPVF